jgi:hypothetical protein
MADSQFGVCPQEELTSVAKFRDNCRQRFRAHNNWQWRARFLRKVRRLGERNSRGFYRRVNDIIGEISTRRIAD